MKILLANPVVWALCLLALVASIYSVRAALGYANVARDAEDDFAYKTPKAMIPAGLSKEAYVEIYRRVNNPRAAAYVAGGLWSILLLTPVIFKALEWGLNLIYNLSGQNRVIEPGYLVWQFIIFFAVMMIWAGIAYGFARHFHRHAPGSLQYELDQAVYGEPD
ncbi:hypothetical protein ACJ3XI_11025 [Litorimonas sp. RW-G-Af-16]|uniref:hypothetical protein n=1 Tax=Litorimonas sp. RW-G-Af-16 TaxID=3241168 RepID=UPI00390C5BCA